MKNLYESFDSPEFEKDLQRLDELVKDLDEWTKKNLSDDKDPESKISTFLKKEKELMTTLYKIYSFAHLSMAVDTRNATAKQVMEKVEGKESEMKPAGVRFQRWVSELGDTANLEQTGIIAEHQFYLQEEVEKSQYLLPEEVEVTIAQMRNTGSLAWRKLWQVSTSTLMIDVEVQGERKRLPLPAVRNLAYSPDPATRRKGYDAELASYILIEDSTSAALNGIKGESMMLSKKRGYDSMLQETLLKSRLDQETLDAMLSAMRESLPSFRKYYRKKAKLLGHANGLPFYDLFAPMGEGEMSFSLDEARKFIVSRFRSFSDELAEFCDNAFEKRWIDADPREGKLGGAFCLNIHPIGESRVLANYTESFDSMTTLAHELGHAYHGHCLKDVSILNASYTMPVAETASIFNETVVVSAALSQATEEEKVTILENQLSSAGQVIVDIYSRYLFETELFNRRENGSLSVNELKEIMLDAQKKAYGDGLDHEYLHPYMWANKPHYYYPTLNFYNFPYAFGLLFGKGVYAKYLEMGDEFLPQYKNLLRETGKRKVADVAKLMDIDVHDKAFWKQSLGIIEKDIENFEKM